MKVTFSYFGPEIASSRLRGLIPQNEMSRRGIKQGKDVLIYGKHFLNFSDIREYGVKIFDICDDHFKTEELKDYYFAHAERADALTCNSEVMRQRIKEETGRDATVIPEPYETPELKPKIGPVLYWFGHKSNIFDFERLRPSLKQEYIVMSNYPGYPEWTPERHRKIINYPCIVIIPTGKSMAKSENRMVEAIRGGHYVCAESLPAYEPFSEFFPLGDIPAHIDRALSDPEGSIEKIRAAQDYIRDRYSPKTIGDKWLEVIHGTEHIHRT